MAIINTNLNVFGVPSVNGKPVANGVALFDMSDRILVNKPTLGYRSIIDYIANPMGAEGFRNGIITKQVKRVQTEAVAATTIGDAYRYIGVLSQWVATVTPYKKIREDSIIVSNYDVALLAEGAGPNPLITEAANFIETGRVLDAQELLGEALTNVATIPIWTSATAGITGGLHTSVVPSGAQPAQTANTYVAALTALNAGKRVVQVTDAELDAAPERRMTLARAALTRATQIGSLQSSESLYPFAINGLDKNNFVIITTYGEGVKMADSNATLFRININAGIENQYSRLIGSIDGVPVLTANELPTNVRFALISNRVFLRSLDPQMQYLGDVIRANTAIVRGSNTAVAVGPDEWVLRFKQGRMMGFIYQDEIWFVNRV